MFSGLAGFGTAFATSLPLLLLSRVSKLRIVSQISTNFTKLCVFCLKKCVAGVGSSATSKIDLIVILPQLNFWGVLVLI